MCNTQTTTGVELQGNGNAVANVKNVEIKPEFLELQELIIDWFGGTKIAAKKLQNIYFHFITLQIETDACSLESYKDELFLIQEMINIFSGKEDEKTQNDTEQENKQIEVLQNENKELKKQLRIQTEQINMLTETIIETNKKK